MVSSRNKLVQDRNSPEMAKAAYTMKEHFAGQIDVNLAALLGATSLQKFMENPAVVVEAFDPDESSELALQTAKKMWFAARAYAPVANAKKNGDDFKHMNMSRGGDSALGCLDYLKLRMRKMKYYGSLGKISRFTSVHRGIYPEVVAAITLDGQPITGRSSVSFSAQTFVGRAVLTDPEYSAAYSDTSVYERFEELFGVAKA